MDAQRIKALFNEVLESYLDSEETCIVNMSGNIKEELDTLVEKVKEYSRKMDDLLDN